MRRTSRRHTASLLAAVLALAVLPAAAPPPAGDVRLVPPAGQTAVRGGQDIGVEGTADAAASVMVTTLFALDVNGDTIESYDLSGLVSNDGGTITGAFGLGCSLIPGCRDNDMDRRARVDGYQLELELSSGGGTQIARTPVLEFDEQRPSLIGYYLIPQVPPAADGTSNRIEVRFSEDVTDPEGDNTRDWQVDGQRQVTRISGQGDRRVLETFNSFSMDATPRVDYLPQPGFSVLPNEVYRDEAGNTLTAARRFENAADRIPPIPPTIEAIAGGATSRDGEDQAVAVLGSDATPVVTLSSIEDGHTVRVFLDDGDGTLEDDRDQVVGEAVASGGTAEVTWPADLALPDDTHRLFARSFDAAACDPNDPSSGVCPNPSGRSKDALYDLDTIAPEFVDDSVPATSRAITVTFTESVFGTNAPADWRIESLVGTPPSITAVEGSGDTRVLRLDGPVPGPDLSTLVYEPPSSRYADTHGNELADDSLLIIAAAQPVLTLVDAVSDEGTDPGGIPVPPYVPQTLDFRIELSDPVPAGSTAEVTLEVVAGTAGAGSDYTAPSPNPFTVSIAENETGADVDPITVTGDGLDEFDEQLTLRVVSTTDVQVADGEAVGTITDDDRLSVVSVAGDTVTEGELAQATVSLDRASGKPITVGFTLEPDSASPDDDYEVVTGSVSIPAGDTSALIDIRTMQDELDELDEESFDVVLGDVLNAELPEENRRASVTISDDDVPPTVRITDVSGFEGDATRSERLIVTLSAVSGREIEVDYRTLGDSATTGSDFESASGTVTIPPGGSGAAFPVTILGDEIPEPDEVFNVELTAARNADVSDPLGLVTLVNDDGDLPPIQLDVTGGEVDEDDAPFGGLLNDSAELVYTFTLSEAARAPVRIDVATTGAGTATPDADFEPKTDTVFIDQGNTEGTFTVLVKDDALNEATEQVAIEVQKPAGVTLPDGAASIEVLGDITDDDPLPTVAFAEGSTTVVVTEGDPATFTVELNTPSGRDVEVDFRTVFDGSATTEDVDDQTGTVLVPEGATTATFEVLTRDDALAEPDEDLTIELNAPVNAVLDSNRVTSASLELADDEIVLPTLSVTPGTGDEDPLSLPNPTSPTPVTFELELSQAVDRDVRVDVRTGSAGTATAEDDFTAQPRTTVTIPRNTTSFTVEVPVLQDAIDEFDETVQLLVSRPVGARLEGGVDELASFGTIVDDDPLAQVGITDATVDEGDLATLDITLDTESGKTIEVEYRTVDGIGSADVDDDYTATSGTVTFAPGETATTITVPTRDDAVDEPDEETFTVRLAIVEDETAAFSRREATVTITDNDLPVNPNDPPVVSLSGASVDEGDPSTLPLTPNPVLSFEVLLNRQPDSPVEVTFETIAGSAQPGEGGDFTARSDSVTIGTDADSATIEVEVTPDLIDEIDEELALRITGVTNATLPGGASTLQRTARILDDDPLATVAFDPDTVDVGVGEGGTVTLTVELEGATQKDVSVDWTTSFDGAATTADAGSQSGTVELPAGTTSASFDVTTLDDTLDEPSESFSVVLSSPANAGLGARDVATITIVDDEVVLPVLRVSGGEVQEGAPFLVPFPAEQLRPQLVWELTLSEATGEDVTVDFTTTDGGAAVAGKDYIAKSGRVTIEADDTTATVSVPVLGDELDEFDEDVVLRLTRAVGATLDGGGNRLDEAATVLDDDPLATVGLGDDADVAEGDSATVTVSLDTVSGKDVVVRVQTLDDDADAGADYRAIDRQVTIPAGEQSRTVSVQTLDDALDEPDETLRLRLSLVGDDRATLGRDTTTLTILDDDTTPIQPGVPVLLLTGDAAEEGNPLPGGVAALTGGTLEFVIGLSEPADGPVVVSYRTIDGTATADEDYVPVDGQVTIPSGETEATVPVGLIADSIDEPDEEFLFRITDVSGDAQLPSGGLQRTGRILDDDPLAQLRIGDDAVLEGSIAELAVTLDRPSAKDVAVLWSVREGSATRDDVVSSGGTVVIPAGSTSGTISIETVADGVMEGVEQLEVVLRAPANASIDDGEGTLTIVDIGAPPVVSVESASEDEGNSGSRIVRVPVTLTSPSTTDTTVEWTSQRLTAAPEEDYLAPGGEVVIPAGATSAQIEVTFLGDTVEEFDEDFLIVLTDADAFIAGPLGRVTIVNDDSADDGAGGGDGDGDGDGDGTDGTDPDGSGGTDGDGDLGAPDAGDGELPATGGGAALLGLTALAGGAVLLRRRRDDD